MWGEQGHRPMWTSSVITSVNSTALFVLQGPNVQIRGRMHTDIQKSINFVLKQRKDVISLYQNKEDCIWKKGRVFPT